MWSSGRLGRGSVEIRVAERSDCYFKGRGLRRHALAKAGSQADLDANRQLSSSLSAGGIWANMASDHGTIQGGDLLVEVR